TEQHEFQAETRKLLDIVGKSLYSEKEVFIRELISNASDSLEKLRYLQNTSECGVTRPLSIEIITDKHDRTLTIQFKDSGIGMTKEEIISNLGTIARSGSKQFIEEIEKKGGASQESNIIGQFGVGFYSSFMVANKVEVYTKSFNGTDHLKWTSEGTGSYTIENTAGDEQWSGMKVVLHLKPECREFADENIVEGVIKKYSNFVGFPILLNDRKVNQLQPLWMLDPKTVTTEQHNEFYKFISKSSGQPRFVLHFRVDVPFTLNALLYFPQEKMGLFELDRHLVNGVVVYSNKVLIKSDATNIVPKWLRFLRGVIDSEDLPLNLSRELLQNTTLLSKLRSIISSRVVKFLCDKATKGPTEYEYFYNDFSVFIKEGIVTSPDDLEKEELAKLLRFESLGTKPGEKTTLTSYCKCLQPEQKSIFYLTAPSRVLAENSPYLEAFREKNVDVLFCYEPHDELVLVYLKKFMNYKLLSVETELRNQSVSSNKPDTAEEDILNKGVDGLISWIKGTFKGRIYSVCVTNKLDKHPCIVTVEEMAAARQFVRTQFNNLNEDKKLSILQPRLEINARLLRLLYKYIYIYI
ncbi:hypothetical protein AAG570_008035, partial [Ranatra chinensis]